VDAVVIPTDKGHEHVERCRPFVEAGLPLFVDKPLVDNARDLETFNVWVAEGKPILSSSCMRYAKEYMPYRASTYELGEIRYASITTSARNTGSPERNVVHFKHRSGADVVVVANMDMYGSFGVLTLCGTRDHVQVCTRDTFYAFQTQLKAFIAYLRTGVRPFPYEETEELMRMVIAGIRSREQGGAEVEV